MTAGACLAGAALLALRLDARPGGSEAFGCFALLAALPWLGTKFIPAGLVIGWFAVRPLRRAHRRTLAVGAVELALFSVALFVGTNEALYDSPTPYGADTESPTDVSTPAGYVERAYRLVALFIDRDYGLLRWAPLFALAFGGLWWLWHSHRERVARRCRPCATSSWPPRSAPPRWASSSWWPPSWRPRCSASGSRRGTCSPGCRWRSRSWRWACATRRAWAPCSRS